MPQTTSLDTTFQIGSPQLKGKCVWEMMFEITTICSWLNITLYISSLYGDYK